MSADYGALTVLVKTVAAVVSATAAIGLAWRGRARWEPSEEDLPAGPQRVGGLLTAVAIALLWTLGADVVRIRFLTMLAIGTALACLAALLVYSLLIGMQTYIAVDTSGASRVERKVIGGFRLTESASAELRAKKLTVQGLLKRYRYDPDRVWTRLSRSIAKLCFIVCYILLTLTGSVALSAASVLLVLKATPSGEAPGPRDRSVVHIAIILNGDVHHTRDAMEAFKSRLDDLLANTSYTAHYEHVVGFPESSKHEENVRALDQLLRRFPKTPDYLVTVGTEVSKVAKERYFNKIPIVFTAITYAVEAGLVPNAEASAERGNIAGVVYPDPARTLLAFLTETFPGKRYGYVYSPDYPQDVILRDHLLRMMQESRAPIRVVPIATNSTRLSQAQLSSADIMFGRYLVATRINDFISNNPKPFIGNDVMFVQVGAVACIATTGRQLGALAAERVVAPNLLKHTALSAIPIVAAEGPTVSLNLSAARRFGRTIPQSAVRKAKIVVP